MPAELFTNALGEKRYQPVRLDGSRLVRTRPDFVLGSLKIWAGRHYNDEAVLYRFRWYAEWIARRGERDADAWRVGRDDDGV